MGRRDPLQAAGVQPPTAVISYGIIGLKELKGDEVLKMHESAKKALVSMR
jgi:hypothetical protein